MNRFHLQLIGALMMFASTTAFANPAHKASLSKHFGRFLHSRADTCKLCHVADHGHEATSLEEFPHNSFGNSVRAARESLGAKGQDDTLPASLKSVGQQDADGDGITNIVEILLGSMPGDRNDVPTKQALDKAAEITNAYREHINRYRWQPFRSVIRPNVPTMEGSCDNPIDAFIHQQHQRHGLVPRGEAKPEQLVRRLSLDLIGLNPTPDQIRNFVLDYERDKRAYSRLVDSLLNDPAYGERWGRHWMDIWRYSDWAGYRAELRESQRHIWHWRDWIVESLNADKPYDQMVRQMLAADEMVLDDESELRATGYLARHYYKTNRDQWMDNVVKHTSQAFMGVTLGCAKCHDHMTDPFPQTEYYAMRAIFEPYNIRTDRVRGELDINKNGLPRAYDAAVSAKTYLFTRGDERFPSKESPIQPASPALLGGKLKIVPVSLSPSAIKPAQRSFVIDDLRHAALQNIERAKHPTEIQAAKKANEALLAELNLEMRESEGLTEKSDQWKQLARNVLKAQREATKLTADWSLIQTQRKHAAAKSTLAKANTSKSATAIRKAKSSLAVADKALKAATAAQQKAVGELEKELTVEFKRRPQKTYPATSTGRRLAFARWLTDRKNPLTARVAMNHIWLRHFGKAIVPTVNDFGAGGQNPTHPALLDWLAAEFMSRDWSMKQMHRLIVSSATYRMSSTNDATNSTIDPDNVFIWKRPSQRMEGEIVRDNLLHVAGKLDRTFGGPEISNDQDQTSRRRSIYLRHAHEKLVEFVQIFDGPAVSECYMRQCSVQPHQALALANSPLSVSAASVIADQLKEATISDSSFVEEAFLTVLSRPPTPDELDACLPFLQDGNGAKRNLILVLLNHNDFVTIR